MQSDFTAPKQTPCEGAGNGSEEMGNKHSKRANNNNTLLNFSEPCKTCLKDKGKWSCSVYCLNCFHVECSKKCPSACNGNEFESFMNTTMSEVKKNLLEKIRHKRAHEYYISDSRQINVKIHHTTVETKITMSKKFEIDGEDTKEIQIPSLTNCMRMTVIEADKKVEVYVKIEDDYLRHAIGVFIKDNDSIEKQFEKEFEERLKHDPIEVTRVQDCVQYLQNQEGPIFVACILRSRLKSDVVYTLEGIKEELLGRIILVLVHYRIDDTDCQADNLKYDYSDLRSIDYFQQDEINNIEEVMKRITDIIFND